MRVHPAEETRGNVARMYEAWLNGAKVGDPADVYRVGQVVPLE